VLRNGRGGRGPDELREAILLATVGIEQSACRAVRDEANRLKSDGALVVTACAGRSCEQPCLNEAASSERFAFRSWEWGFIGEMVADLARSQGPAFHPVEHVTIDDWLTEKNLTYSGGGLPNDVVRNHLTWRLAAWPAEGISLTYRARAVACGRFRLSERAPQAEVTFNDTFWLGVAPHPFVVTSTDPALNPIVVIPCPTPTVPPTASATPGPSPTPIPPPSATPTATAPVTPRPHLLFLPHALPGGCALEWNAVDVALAVDVSGSMMAAAGGDDHRSRREVARHVARAMVDGLRPGRDRVSVVVYGDEEYLQVLAPLADCCGAARLALDLLPRYDGSRMDLAVDEAAVQLTGPAARGDAGKALILLTDGDLNRTPLDRLAASADAARRAGITLSVVGIGGDADAGTLQVVTGSASRVFLTRRLPVADLARLLAPVPRCRR
jgi:hypothetical protein